MSEENLLPADLSWGPIGQDWGQLILDSILDKGNEITMITLDQSESSP